MLEDGVAGGRTSCLMDMEAGSSPVSPAALPVPVDIARYVCKGCCFVLIEGVRGNAAGEDDFPSFGASEVRFATIPPPIDPRRRCGNGNAMGIQCVTWMEEPAHRPARGIDSTRHVENIHGEIMSGEGGEPWDGATAHTTRKRHTSSAFPDRNIRSWSLHLLTFWVRRRVDFSN